MLDLAEFLAGNHTSSGSIYCLTETDNPWRPEFCRFWKNMDGDALDRSLKVKLDDALGVGRIGEFKAEQLR